MQIRQVSRTWHDDGRCPVAQISSPSRGKWCTAACPIDAMTPGFHEKDSELISSVSHPHLLAIALVETSSLMISANSCQTPSTAYGSSWICNCMVAQDHPTASALYLYCKSVRTCIRLQIFRMATRYDEPDLEAPGASCESTAGCMCKLICSRMSSAASSCFEP